ncbi:MAG: hypothetical protein A2Y38_13030 [Spirochaetes bacterium GWB1_59_5]|nr:MAG: hypothetical protein A2Y38_13030 [Spirochaetes bacterium GWB1_59_5]
MSPEKTILGGRTFVPVTESTVEHDLYFHGLAGRAGLRFEKGERETPEDFGARILDETVQSGKALELIGCLMVPEEVGVDGWTPEEARKTAAFIGQLRGDEDKARVRGLILSLLMDFFRCGLASIWTSQSSSRIRPTDSQTEFLTATAAGAAS